MKKLKYFILILISVILITGCGNKKAIDSNKFKKIMTDMDFQIVDVKQQFASINEIKEAIVALEKNRKYQIEFYVLDTNDSAKKLYGNNKEIFESSKGSSSSYATVDLGNTNKYTLSTDGRYKLVSRIDNTMIYLNVSNEYKDEINKILKKLGY